LIHNVFQTATVILYFQNIDSEISDYIKLFNTLYVHYVWIWPVIARLIYITQSIYYNYSFIRKNLKLYSYQKKEEANQNKKFTHKKNSYISKLVILPFFSLFIIFLIFTFIGRFISKEFECYFFSFNSLIYVVNKDCLNDSIDKNIVLGLIILKYSIDFVLHFIITTLLYIVNYRFKIKNDKFLIKTEVKYLAICWFLLDNFYHGFILFHDKFDEYLFNFIYNVSQDFAFILMYFILTYKRKKIDSREFYVVLNNYDMFMQNPIYFNYFREYIQKYYEDEEGCLVFWRRYQHYKSTFENNNLMDNINYAYSIFTDCIYDPKMSCVNEKLSNNLSIQIADSDSKKTLIVELPYDVYERIEEVVNQNFTVDVMILYELFDESFQIINGKLYNRYLSMFRNQQEYEKMKKLIRYIEFDMVDYELIKIETPNISRVRAISQREKMSVYSLNTGNSKLL
jgi:hypothetical protein